MLGRAITALVLFWAVLALLRAIAWGADRWFSSRGPNVRRPSRSREPDWIRLQIAWLLRAVVRSDSDVHADQRELLRRFLGPRFGPDFELAGAFGGAPPRLAGGELRDLARSLARALSASERETVLDWCCQLARVDDRILPEELEVLTHIARGLGIAEREVHRLIFRTASDAGSARGARPPGPSAPPDDPRARAYAVLGLAPGAPHAELRARYRELARTYHPDRHEHLGEVAARESEARFREIRAAYDLLVG